MAADTTSGASGSTLDDALKSLIGAGTSIANTVLGQPAKPATTAANPAAASKLPVWLWPAVGGLAVVVLVLFLVKK